MNPNADFFKRHALELKQEGYSWDDIRKDLPGIADAFRKKNYTSGDIEDGIRSAMDILGEILLIQRDYSIGTGEEPWFRLEMNSVNSGFWNYYEERLQAAAWPARSIESVKTHSEMIVNRLVPPRVKFNPDNKNNYKRKGLVLGYVQSGKTASMAGIISMYADAGCSIFIILSGVNNNLQQQTEKRFRKDLGVDDRKGWYYLPENINNSAQKIEGVSGILIGVFKKNARVLDNLIKYYKSVNNPSYLLDHQILIIDDECDQAAPNGKDYKKEERTAINRKITDLLELLPRASYIGYTATPFANVLNEPPAPKSLYPENFIHALPEPPAYFGTKQVFGRMPSGNEDEGVSGLDVINTIPSEEIKKLRGRKSEPEVTLSLENAVLYFIMATACRYLRGQIKHSSMLVHITQKVALQNKISKELDTWLSVIKKEIASGKTALIDRMKNIWDEESQKVSEDDLCRVFPDYHEDTEGLFPGTPDFKTIKPYFAEVINRICIKTDNSGPSADRAVYKDDETAVYIVIGGNTLSRGLTLEGLVVSFFLRTATTYDALLQMGRWFGYRHGYEDLPRVWIPSELKEAFQFLSLVEQELREEINQYTEGLTPADIGLSIRTHPDLQVVRKKAMQAAVPFRINYLGKRIQTTYFRGRDDEWLNHNWEAGVNLLKSIENKRIKSESRIIFEGAEFDYIKKFISDYRFHESSQLNNNIILEFIKKANKNGYLGSWNVVLKSSHKSRNNINITDSIEAGLVTRSKLKGRSADEAYIKTLMSPGDILADIDYYKIENETAEQMLAVRNSLFNNNPPGLLILYPIDKDSTPDKGNMKERECLNAAAHVMGAAFVFPKSRPGDTGLFDKITIDLEMNTVPYYEIEDTDDVIDD